MVVEKCSFQKKVQRLYNSITMPITLESDAKLIGYKLPDTSVHQWLRADQYGCSYDESKGRTFRILYGGVSDEDRKIPFFDKVDKFIHDTQLKSIERGYLQTPKGRKIPLGWIEQPIASKVFQLSITAHRNGVQY